MLTKKEITLSIAFVLACPCGSKVQAKQAGSPSVPELTVCEALAHAEQYDGKLVQIRGKAFSTEEGASFVGENCPKLVTDGKVWPNAIAWTMPSDSMSIVHPVNFKYDWGSRKLLKHKYNQLRKRTPAACIELTYTGMFEVWSLQNSKKKDSKGTPYEIPGFGHLNEAGAQLVLKSADDATAIPNCRVKD
jgi:hypothetical protein